MQNKTKQNKIKLPNKTKAKHTQRLKRNNNKDKKTIIQGKTTKHKNNNKQ